MSAMTCTNHGAALPLLPLSRVQESAPEMLSKESTIVRFRIDPEFKAEVEALAAAKQISVSALTRQLLAEAVETHRLRTGQRPSSAEADAAA